jgi:hypothetical protein
MRYDASPARRCPLQSDTCCSIGCTCCNAQQPPYNMLQHGGYHIQLATCREQTNTADGRHARPRPPSAACAVRLSLCYFGTSVQYAAVEKLLRAAESALRRPLLHATNGGVPRLTLAALQLAPAADRVKARFSLQPPCRVPASTHHRVSRLRAVLANARRMLWVSHWCYCCAHWLCCGTTGRLPVSQ